VTAAVAAGKEVVCGRSPATHRTLGGVVVDRQIPVVQVTHQRRPLVQGISDRPAQRTLGQDLLALLEKAIAKLTVPMLKESLQQSLDLHREYAQSE
jgi:hypothetical protein